MDRTYVTQQQKTPVFQLGLELWRDNVVRNTHIRGRLQAILLDFVLKERTGDVINRSLFRAITQVGMPCYLCCAALLPYYGFVVCGFLCLHIISAARLLLEPAAPTLPAPFE